MMLRYMKLLVVTDELWGMRSRESAMKPWIPKQAILRTDVSAILLEI